jgi:hypothetical protein
MEAGRAGGGRGGAGGGAEVAGWDRGREGNRWEGAVGRVRGKRENDEWAPHVVVGMKYREVKYDECGRSEYKGENFDDEVGMFCFEEDFEVSRVWMVLEHA